MKRLWILIALVSISCSLNSAMKKPELELPSTIIEDSKGESRIPSAWWKQFNDQLLDKLIDEALRNNDDLMIAASRIDQAGALLGLSSAELYPFITASGSVTSREASDEVSNGGGTKSTFSVSGMVSYEIDLWKRLKNKKEADLRRLLSTRAARDSIEISIISAVASTYFNLISIEKQIETAQEIMNRQKDIYEFRLKQFVHGIIDELVLVQSKAEYESTMVLLETLKAQRENIKSSLLILIGKSPKEIFEGEIKISKDLPQQIPLPSIPSESLLKRPDIVQAEEGLRAANLEISAARARYFPSIALTGALGLTSNELNNLLRSSASFWNIGASVVGTIFDFGRTKSTVMLREAQEKEAMLQYVKTVRMAFKEVYDSLRNLEQSLKRLEAQKTQLLSLERILKLAEKKYERGLTDYLTVLDSQRGYLNARINLIKLKTEVLNNQVSLYKALGGGWEDKQEER